MAAVASRRYLSVTRMSVAATDLYDLERAGELDPLLSGMTNAFRASCVQLRSSDDVAENIRVTSELDPQSKKRKARNS